MTKAFEMMRAGLEEALAYARGEADVSKYKLHVPEKIDVKLLRTEMGLTQDEFAQRYLFTAARVKDWEQGRSAPDSATRAYLTVIMRNAKAVDRALRAGVTPKGEKSSPQPFRLRRSEDRTGVIATRKRAASHKNAG